MAMPLTCVMAAQSAPQVADGKITGPDFTITVPPDLKIQAGANEESLHGFLIDLTPRPAGVQQHSNRADYRYIAFDTRWDTGDMPSLSAVTDEIAANLLAHIPEELVGSGDVTLSANLPAKLGPLPARRLIMNYRNTERKPAIRQVIVAYNARKDASAVVYFLILNTTQQNFEEDVTLFSKIMAGFKLTGQ
jgi:hypothetical protein